MYVTLSISLKYYPKKVCFFRNKNRLENKGLAISIVSRHVNWSTAVCFEPPFKLQCSAEWEWVYNTKALVGRKVQQRFPEMPFWILRKVSAISKP